MSKQHRNVLVVEDNDDLRSSLIATLALRAENIRQAASLQDCRRVLQAFQPELMLLDVALGDGSAFDVLEYLNKLPRPLPVIIAMSGAATRQEAFRLAQLGVPYFIEKPLNRELLEDVLNRASDEAPNIKPLLRASVGRVRLNDVEDTVRESMVRQALQVSSGNRRAAARLLSVSRQLLQHMLRKMNYEVSSPP